MYSDLTWLIACATHLASSVKKERETQKEGVVHPDKTQQKTEGSKVSGRNALHGEKHPAESRAAIKSFCSRRMGDVTVEQAPSRPRGALCGR